MINYDNTTMNRRNPTASIPGILPEDLAGLDDEARLELAVRAILASPISDDGKHELQVRVASRFFEVKRGTLTNQLKGVRPRSEAHAHERVLSDAEEEVLSEWIRSLGRRSVPVTINMLREYASVRCN